MDSLLLVQNLAIFLFLIFSVFFLFLIRRIGAFEEKNFFLFLYFTLLMIISVLFSFLSKLEPNSIFLFLSSFSSLFANILFMVSALTVFGGIFQISFLVKGKEGKEK